ncbi:hypothetical protein EON65_57325, partial [archaeon]
MSLPVASNKEDVQLINEDYIPEDDPYLDLGFDDLVVENHWSKDLTKEDIGFEDLLEEDIGFGDIAEERNKVNNTMKKADDENEQPIYDKFPFLKHAHDPWDHTPWEGFFDEMEEELDKETAIQKGVQETMTQLFRSFEQTLRLTESIDVRLPQDKIVKLSKPVQENKPNEFTAEFRDGMNPVEMVDQEMLDLCGELLDDGNDVLNGVADYTIRAKSKCGTDFSFLFYLCHFHLTSFLCHTLAFTHHII